LIGATLGWKARLRGLTGFECSVEDSHLILDSVKTRASEDVASQLLLRVSQRSVQPRARLIDRWTPSPVPFWGSGVLVLAVVALATTPIPLSIAAIVGIGVLDALVVIVPLAIARYRGASLRSCLLGFAAPFAVTAFSLVYALLLMWGDITIAASESPAHIADAELLSIGVATTAGTFDYQFVNTPARIAVLMEIVLLLGIVGSSLYALARRIFDAMRSARVDG
jgi:hypothetical protein